MLELIVAGTLKFPEIGSVMFSIGPLDVRYYSVGYILGIVFAWWYIRRLTKKPGAAMSTDHIDDFITWALFGVILGGRIGYILFYDKLDWFLSDPVRMVRLWDGGMSFHGGFAGVVLAVIFYVRKQKLDLMRVSDVVAIVSPVGIFAVRIANFINGELWGRPTAPDAWYGMIFPSDRLQVPRHPSQLYEAFLEGLLLFAILQYLYHRTRIAKDMPGVLAGIFIAGYGLVRILVENVRQPDAHINLNALGLSRGQMLSIPMFLLAAWLISKGLRHRAALKAKGK